MLKVYVLLFIAPLFDLFCCTVIIISSWVCFLTDGLLGSLIVGIHALGIVILLSPLMLLR